MYPLPTQTKIQPIRQKRYVLVPEYGTDIIWNIDPSGFTAACAEFYEWSIKPFLPFRQFMEHVWSKKYYVDFAVCTPDFDNTYNICVFVKHPELCFCVYYDDDFAFPMVESGSYRRFINHTIESTRSFLNTIQDRIPPDRYALLSDALISGVAEDLNVTILDRSFSIPNVATQEDVLTADQLSALRVFTSPIITPMVNMPLFQGFAAIKEDDDNDFGFPPSQTMEYVAPKILSPTGLELIKKKRMELDLQRMELDERMAQTRWEIKVIRARLPRSVNVPVFKSFTRKKFIGEKLYYIVVYFMAILLLISLFIIWISAPFH